MESGEFRNLVFSMTETNVIWITCDLVVWCGLSSWKYHAQCREMVLGSLVVYGGRPRSGSRLWLSVGSSLAEGGVTDYEQRPYYSRSAPGEGRAALVGDH